MAEWDIKVHFETKNAASLQPRKRRIRVRRTGGRQESVFLTFEVYPETKPSPARYFGTWQFGADNIADECEVRVSLSPGGAQLERDGAAVQPSSVINGRLKEDGLYRVYVVLSEKETYAQLARTEYLELISFSGKPLDPVQHWPGSNQRFPRMTEPAYLSLRSIAKMLVRFGRENRISRNTSVLDVGCAHKPYYPFFAPTACRYVGTEIFDGQFVDAVWEPEKPMPFAEASFDFAVSTQVLEHVSDPEHVAGEIYRVLKPGGKVFLSAPFAWEKHDYPGDYWRFSEEGLRKIFSAFKDCRITPNGNSRQCFTELRNLHTHRTMEPGLVRDFLIGSRNWIAEKLYSKSKDFAMPSNFVVIATR